MSEPSKRPPRAAGSQVKAEPQEPLTLYEMEREDIFRIKKILEVKRKLIAIEDAEKAAFAAANLASGRGYVEEESALYTPSAAEDDEVLDW